MDKDKSGEISLHEISNPLLRWDEMVDGEWYCEWNEMVDKMRWDDGWDKMVDEIMRWW